MVKQPKSVHGVWYEYLNIISHLFLSIVFSAFALWHFFPMFPVLVFNFWHQFYNMSTLEYFFLWILLSILKINVYVIKLWLHKEFKSVFLIPSAKRKKNKTKQTHFLHPNCRQENYYLLYSQHEVLYNWVNVRHYQSEGS